MLSVGLQELTSVFKKLACVGWSERMRQQHTNSLLSLKSNNCPAFFYVEVVVTLRLYASILQQNISSVRSGCDW